jgi:hypothetical protein
MLLLVSSLVHIWEYYESKLELDEFRASILENDSRTSNDFGKYISAEWRQQLRALRHRRR